MKQISEISFDFQLEETRTNRNSLIKQLYQLYISQPDYNRFENRKRYRFWMSKNHPKECHKIGFNLERYNQYKEDFKKAKLPPQERYLKYEPENRFWRHFTHLKGESGEDALRHMISVAKDKLHRNQNVAQYILGSLKYEKES